MKAPPFPAERDLDAEEIRAFFEAWGQDASKEDASCEFCSAITISTQDNVRAKLEILTLRLSTPKGSILSCPRCGQLYQHVSWMESPDWLDSMSGITEPYENECLYK